MSSSVSERITVWFLLREELTFLTGQALRTASLTWASHIPHIIPLTSTVYFHMFSHSFLTVGSSSCADRTVVCRAAVRSSGIFLAIRQHRAPTNFREVDGERWNSRARTGMPSAPRDQSREEAGVKTTGIAGGLSRPYKGLVPATPQGVRKIRQSQCFYWLAPLTRGYFYLPLFTGSPVNGSIYSFMLI